MSLLICKLLHLEYYWDFFFFFCCWTSFHTSCWLLWHFYSDFCHPHFFFHHVFQNSFRDCSPQFYQRNYLLKSFHSYHIGVRNLHSPNLSSDFHLFSICSAYGVLASVFPTALTYCIVSFVFIIFYPMGFMITIICSFCQHFFFPSL